jgi:hypothetical protein
MFPRKLTRSIVVGAAAIAVAGGSYGIVSATSGSGSTAAASTTPPASSSGGGGSNARSGPAAGGSSGTVSSLSTSGFTITTPAGQKVTVKETSSTTYRNGTSPASATAITTGEPVLALGTTSSTTITATQVTVQPAGSEGSAASSAAGVVPFQQGAPATSKTVGQIPADYTGLQDHRRQRLDGYPRFPDAAHQQLNGPVVLVWDAPRVRPGWPCSCLTLRSLHRSRLRNRSPRA